ncbi:hypothetical protein K435DRAFT_742176 [Dendrothele bispora CBS 962.96]|uniref:Uncharacterized protein n=1 Tax=Dendrothele bispora (strain CBS 962.96) TaxID=1314807 RepID=A0A4S8MV91_DENBC|nr:hypothetical protein K435DRAFT_742176 [Dendrothele bispora CBS 962.96]
MVTLTPHQPVDPPLNHVIVRDLSQQPAATVPLSLDPGSNASTPSSEDASISPGTISPAAGNPDLHDVKLEHDTQPESLPGGPGSRFDVSLFASICGIIYTFLTAGRRWMSIYNNAHHWIPLMQAIWISLPAIHLRNKVSSATRIFRPVHIPLVVIGALSLRAIYPLATALTQPPELHAVDYGELMVIQNSAITNLASGGVSFLAANLKKTKMATSELAMEVYYSDIPSHELLADQLQTLSSTADTAYKGLIDFDAKVASLPNSLQRFNRQTLRYLKSIENKNVFHRTIQSLMLHEGDDVVLARHFANSMSDLSEIVKLFVLEVEKHIYPLKKMEQQLKEIHRTVKQDASELSEAQEEVLASLWTQLGWNKRQTKGFEENFILLLSIDGYRKEALARVEGALLQLDYMEKKMEQLRLRLRAPELLGPRIAMEDHIQSIEIGINNLNEAKMIIQAREAEVYGQFQLEA